MIIVLIVMINKERFAHESDRRKGDRKTGSSDKRRAENYVMMWRRWEHVIQSSTWVKS